MFKKFSSTINKKCKNGIPNLSQVLSCTEEGISVRGRGQISCFDKFYHFFTLCLTFVRVYSKGDCPFKIRQIYMSENIKYKIRQIYIHKVLKSHRTKIDITHI